MKKLYEVTLNECVAESIMNHISERSEHDPAVVDKLAEVVPVVPSDCSNVTVKVTADEMAEILNAIIHLMYWA